MSSPPHRSPTSSRHRGRVAAGLKVSSKFALCLPHVAIFGGGPVHIPGSADDVETVTDHLSRTRLLQNPRNSAYYVDVAGIAVNGARVALPDGALALSSQGQGGVALSSMTPYTALRPDIYRAVLAAFDAAMAGLPRVSQAPKPLERCFNLTVMNQMGTWTGSLPVAVDLMLADGKNWTFTSLSAMHEVVPQTLCFAFVEMGAGTAAAYAVPDSPAVVVGGHHMENNLLEFDHKMGVLRGVRGREGGWGKA
ncbi:chitinase CLP-like [Miscanthus floridulus]|uniref:chitinase CLP-like n=1 Tax=Miscanthus floridulus TaxID=154761 RepID=UPI003458D74B